MTESVKWQQPSTASRKPKYHLHILYGELQIAASITASEQNFKEQASWPSLVQKQELQPSKWPFEHMVQKSQRLNWQLFAPLRETVLPSGHSRTSCVQRVRGQSGNSQPLFGSRETVLPSWQSRTSCVQSVRGQSGNSQPLFGSRETVLPSWQSRTSCVQSVRGQSGNSQPLFGSRETVLPSWQSRTSSVQKS